MGVQLRPVGGGGGFEPVGREVALYADPTIGFVPPISRRAGTVGLPVGSPGAWRAPPPRGKWPGPRASTWG